MANSDCVNLAKLLQYSPNELSSGVLITNWIQSSTLSTTSFEFDLSQIEPEPKDSVTKYLNWVCLNAKVFNNFGILLNSSQINNFIDGKSTEIYIILKQLHDKMKEKIQQHPTINSTKSAPSPSREKKENINKITSQTPNIQQQLANFPSLSLAISPTISNERQIGQVMTSSHSNEIGPSSKTIPAIKEQETQATKDEFSLLTPDLNDIKKLTQESKFRLLNPNNGSIQSIQTEKIANAISAFQQFEDYVIYDGTKLFGDNICDFLNEKEKLEAKLNDAMSSYQSNNVSYLNNIVQQYKMQKLKICQDITDQTQQNNFLKKLQNDLDVLDESLQKQFEESRKTLYDQLTAIHHKRLKEFAIKLNQKSQYDISHITDDVHTSKPEMESIQLEACENINNQNINIPIERQREKEAEYGDGDELNETLRQVSNLLEKCWKNEMKKQQQISNKETEIDTLKVILSVYENLSKLIQLQSNTLKTTIIDSEHLYMGNNSDYQDDYESNVVITRTDNASPDDDKTHVQIQLLSSSENILTNPQHFTKSSGKKKKRKGSKKALKKSSCKAGAFSFADTKYIRQTVSSQNKKIHSKKRGKKSNKNI